MECILARARRDTDNYNFTKKLADNIKQTKDANADETDDANHVCTSYLSPKVKQKWCDC